MRGDEHFKIASLTKTYTATVVLQLVQERRLRLSDSVARWLPGLVPNGRRVTIHQLLNHTSGIPDYESDERYLKPYLSGNLGFYWSPRQLVKLAVSHPACSPPARRARRRTRTPTTCCSASSSSASRGARSARAEPPDLPPTRPASHELPDEAGAPEPVRARLPRPRRAAGHRRHRAQPVAIAGLGAIVSTAAETTRFYRALLSGRLLRPATMKAMKTTISEGEHVDIPGQRYGYGLESFPTPCGRAWGHNGVVPGYFTFVFANGDGSRQALLMVNHDAQTLPATRHSTWRSSPRHTAARSDRAAGGARAPSGHMRWGERALRLALVDRAGAHGARPLRARRRGAHERGDRGIGLGAQLMPVERAHEPGAARPRSRWPRRGPRSRSAAPRHPASSSCRRRRTGSRR